MFFVKGAVCVCSGDIHSSVNNTPRRLDRCHRRLHHTNQKINSRHPEQQQKCSLKATPLFLLVASYFGVITASPVHDIT